MIWEKLKELFAHQPVVAAVFKPEWEGYLEANLPLYGRLPEDLKVRLRDKIARFVRSTFFEGCGGLELDEEMILTVAGQACLLVVNHDGEPYPGLRTVLLYPSTFSSNQVEDDGFGLVSEGVVHRLGESWSNGTVVLAWDSVSHGARNIYDGENVAFHEFAHQLDSQDGPTDGAPPLKGRQEYREWASVLSHSYADFTEMVDQGDKTVIDVYGAIEPAEFFAVVTETFFEKPRQLRKKRPSLYKELQKYYKLDPASWFGRR